MELRRIPSEKEKTTLAVDKGTFILVKAYAEEKGLTVAEATFWLLGRGLCAEWGIEWVRKDEGPLSHQPGVFGVPDGRHRLSKSVSLKTAD